jgi:hypothetical protein
MWIHNRRENVGKSQKANSWWIEESKKLWGKSDQIWTLNRLIHFIIITQFTDKQIPINPSVDFLYLSVYMFDISLEVNFGDDPARPFLFDIERTCPGLILENIQHLFWRLRYVIIWCKSFYFDDFNLFIDGIKVCH